MSLRISCGAAIAALAALSGCAQPAAASSSPAQAVRDFYFGLEHRDAGRFCGSIVVKDGQRFERVGLKGCKEDFHNGVFDGALGGTKLLKVLQVSRRHHHASVAMSLQTPHGKRRASMTVYFAFGHWAVPIPPAH